ncbi:MAG: hypothetical protein EU530_11270 [Promethearchaeota archaeon]|nr:MAG: hypothetical protein EU530_11270 [Candidatus Lokiarchaeota archaeon]
MKSDKRHQRQLEKILLEQRHFDYLKNKGFTSLEIADILIHQMFEMMIFGMKQRNPQLTPEELKQNMRNISERELEIRSKRIRG